MDLTPIGSVRCEGLFSVLWHWRIVWVTNLHSSKQKAFLYFARFKWGLISSSGFELSCRWVCVILTFERFSMGFALSSGFELSCNLGLSYPEYWKYHGHIYMDLSLRHICKVDIYRNCLCSASKGFELSSGFELSWLSGLRYPEIWRLFWIRVYIQGGLVYMRIYIGEYNVVPSVSVWLRVVP